MRSEFDLIHRLKRRKGLAKVGDDCAILPQNASSDLAVTADLLIEDVDFRLEWAPAEAIGHKALAVSLSDLAAAGAKPKWALLSIGVPKKLWATDFVDEFYKGWFELAGRYGVELVGGDISRAHKLTIDSIAIGTAKRGRSLLRSGARAGDSIYVTGALGGAAAGLRLLESGVNNARGRARELIRRQLRPDPRVGVSRVLARGGEVSAMIDISDGLAADLHHICDASGVGAVIDGSALPIERGGREFDSEEMRNFALSGGEDFELLFTSRKKIKADIEGIVITRIGEISANAGTVLLSRAGKAQELQPHGFKHF